jgi:hypothetical protein
MGSGLPRCAGAPQTYVWPKQQKNTYPGHAIFDKPASWREGALPEFCTQSPRDSAQPRCTILRARRRSGVEGPKLKAALDLARTPPPPPPPPSATNCICEKSRNALKGHTCGVTRRDSANVHITMTLQKKLRSVPSIRHFAFGPTDFVFR